MIATIGGFDGMHKAHQELIKRADFLIVIEKGSSLTPGFDRFFYTDKDIILFELEKIKNKTAVQFIEILKKMNIRKIIVGEDFKFGNRRAGNIQLLKEHFEVETIKEIFYKDIAIHSRVIREFIKSSQISLANSLLGRNYKIRGIQIKGQGLGSRELVPTINLKLLKPYTLPNGVFATKTNGLNSITFLGHRSTDGEFAIETHILSSEFKVPSSKFRVIEIEFIKFIRENRKFSNLEELKKQIKKDIENAIISLKKA